MPDTAARKLAPTRGFLTVGVDARCYALRAELVREIIRVPPMTRVPQGPQALLGIANLRGAVLPVASLRALLGMSERPPTHTTRAVVLDVGMPVAITVDSVDAVVAVEAERIETAPTELGAEPGERVEGLFQVGGDSRATKILDIARLLDAVFTQDRRSDRQGRRHLAAAVGNLADVAANAEMLVTFDVAGQEFALDLAAVEEILPLPKTRGAVPHAEALVLGVTSFRGSLLPLLSLRGLLGFPLRAGPGAHDKVVVMNVAGAHVGLVADAARSIVAADPDLIDPVPAVVAARMGGESRLRGIYRGDSGQRIIGILAPEQLFREDVIARLSAQGKEASMPTTQAAPSAANELHLVVFRLGSDEFALPISAVEEIGTVPANIRRVPKTPKFLEGVVNLRGSVLPVIDQRRRFDMPSGEHLKGRRLVVVRTEHHRAGLIVDSVSDVLRIGADAVAPAPHLTDHTATLVRGVINIEASARIVLLLDPSELLTRAEHGLLDKFEAAAKQANV